MALGLGVFVGPFVAVRIVGIGVIVGLGVLVAVGNSVLVGTGVSACVAVKVACTVSWTIAGLGVGAMQPATINNINKVIIDLFITLHLSESDILSALIFLFWTIVH